MALEIFMTLFRLPATADAIRNGILMAALLIAAPVIAAPSSPTPNGTTSTGDKPEMRIPVIRTHSLTPEQKVAAEALQAAFGGVSFGDRIPAGPLGSTIADPGFGGPMAMMFEHFHHDPAIDQRLFELAVLTTARAWDAQFEWYAHVGFAEKAGLSKEVIEAIRLGQTPTFVRNDERAIYHMVEQVIAHRKLSQAAFDEAVRVVGRDATVKYLFAAAYYDATSVVVVGLDIQMPPSVPSPLPPLTPTAGR